MLPIKKEGTACESTIAKLPVYGILLKFSAKSTIHNNDNCSVKEKNKQTKKKNCSTYSFTLQKSKIYISLTF